MSVADALQRVRDRVSAAAERSGRDPSAVRIVGVVKGVPETAIEEAVFAGMTDLAENRTKPLAQHIHRFGPGVRWHYVGAIQTNKIRDLEGVALIHSVDRVREAEALNAQAEANDSAFDVLIEVNVAGEPNKQGIGPDEVERTLQRLSVYPRVRPRGFMFMAPIAQKAEDVRWVFTKGRALRERFESFGLDELSMGMSDDFEIAIEEGATIVRIGRAIFEGRATRAKEA